MYKLSTSAKLIKNLPWFSEYIFKCSICSFFWSQMSNFSSWKLRSGSSTKIANLLISMINNQFFVVWLVQYHLHRCQTGLWFLYWIRPKLKFHEYEWQQIMWQMSPTLFKTYPWKNFLDEIQNWPISELLVPLSPQTFWIFWFNARISTNIGPGNQSLVPVGPKNSGPVKQVQVFCVLL